MNPFAALGDSDDEAKTGYNPVDKKEKPVTKPVKKPIEEGRQVKKDVEVNANLNMRQKEDLKVIRNPRQPRPNKEITDHHAHDRRSGTGRVSQPRKNAGGAGGIGNIKDELNQDKILQRVKEDNNDDQTSPKKQPQPEALTLQEYYAKQGLDISKLDKKADQPSKKQAVNAEWITKQKLTVMKTKADNDIVDDNRKVQTLKDNSHKITSSVEQQLLGFTSNGPKKEKSQTQQKDTRQKEGKKGGKPQYEVKKEVKPVIKEQDFPSL